MRLALALLTLAAASPAISQTRLTDQEGAALWADKSAPIMAAVVTVETLRACGLVDEATGNQANERLGGMASDLYWRGLGQPVPQDRWLADFHAAERRGRAEATPATCQAIRNDPLQSGSLKRWADRLAFAGR